jgi:hypothetical protein
VTEPCKGCERSAVARPTPREIERLLAEFLSRHPLATLASEAVLQHRLATCRACPDLTFSGTTCRHCGCFVEIRARLADRACPAPAPRW